jgi:hypothetical protein
MSLKLYVLVWHTAHNCLFSCAEASAFAPKEV